MNVKSKETVDGNGSNCQKWWKREYLAVFSNNIIAHIRKWWRLDKSQNDQEIQFEKQMKKTAYIKQYNI